MEDFDLNSLADAAAPPQESDLDALATATAESPGPSERQRKLAHAVDYYRQNAGEFFGRASPGYILDRLPGGGAGWALDYYPRLYSAAKSFQDGNPSDDDLYTVAQHLAKQDYEENKGRGEKAFDMASKLPAFLAEVYATGGIAGGARATAEKAAERFAAGAAEKAVGSYVGGMAGRAAAGAVGMGFRTTFMPSTAEAIAGQTVGQDAQGMPQPQNLAGAVGKGAVSSVVQNVIMGASGAFAPKGASEGLADYARGAVLSTAGAVGGAQAAKEALYGLALSGKPAEAHTLVSKALKGQLDADAAGDILTEVGVFGGLEGFMHAVPAIKGRFDELKSQGVRPDSPLMQRELQNAAEAFVPRQEEPAQGGPFGFSEEGQRQAPPPAESTPETGGVSPPPQEAPGSPVAAPEPAAQTPPAPAPPESPQAAPEPAAAAPEPAPGPFDHLDEPHLRELAAHFLEPKELRGSAEKIRARLEANPVAVKAREMELAGRQEEELPYPPAPPAATKTFQDRFPAGSQVEYVVPGTSRKASGEVVGHVKDPVTGDTFARVRDAFGREDFAGHANDITRAAAKAPAEKPSGTAIPESGNAIPAEVPPAESPPLKGKAAVLDRVERQRRRQAELGDVKAPEPKVEPPRVEPGSVKPPPEEALTDREQEIINLRRQGVSMAKVGEQFGVTKQRVEQIEKKARGKIVQQESQDKINLRRGAEEAARLLEEGKGANLGDVKGEALDEAAGRRHDTIDAADESLRRLEERYIGEHESGKLTPERKAAYERSGAILAEEAQGRSRPPEGEPGGVPGPEESPAVRELLDYARSRRQPGGGDDAELKQMLKEARKASLAMGYDLRNLAARASRGRIDADSIPRLDEVADEAAKAHPGLFAGHEGREQERLFDLLVQGAKSPKGKSKGKSQAGDAYEPPGASAEKTSAEPWDAEGMGTAGGGGQASVPPPGTPGAGTPPPPSIPPKPSGGWFRSAADWIKSFANQSFPALTRLSEPAGEKLAQVAAAPDAAKASLDYYSRILKVGGKSIADMTPEERQQVGAVWLERRTREYRDYLRRNGMDSSRVRTFVGGENSPLPDEAAYQQGKDALWSFWEAAKQEWTPEVEKNYRGLMGLEPEDAINAPSQIPGLPLNAIALTEADAGKPGVVATGARQDLGNVRLRKPGFTKQAELSAPYYDTDILHMMERTLNLGIPAARRAEFVRAALEDGVLKAVGRGDKVPEGWKYTAIDPARKIPGIDPNAGYYVHPDAYRDVVQGLGIGERPGSMLASGLRPVMDKLYNVALMSPVELATHTANHFTALFRSGMGVPIWNLKDSFQNAYKVWSKDPEVLRRVMELAKIGAAHTHEARPGILGEGLKKYDPTYYANKFTSGMIDTMQKAVRLQLEDAFDRSVRSGLLKGGETAKRDFINQALGNYNSSANNRLTQFLKDTGLQSFATAAHTFTVQGAKTSLGGAINARATSTQGAVQLRAEALLKLLPFVAMGPVINYLKWGQAFPQNVPAFAVKTREDDDGTVHFFDQLKFTGLRRGWRATGQNALIEAATQGGMSKGQVADKMARDFIATGKHMVEGPPGQAVSTFATGEDFTGRRVAEKSKKGEGWQYLENAKAAAKGLNPVVATLSQKEKKPSTFAERVFQSLGPFGEQKRERRRR